MYCIVPQQCRKQSSLGEPRGITGLTGMEKCERLYNLLVPWPLVPMTMLSCVDHSYIANYIMAKRSCPGKQG